MSKLIRVIGIVLSAWCVVYITHVLDYLGFVVAPAQHQAFFLGLLLPLTFIVYPSRKKSPGVKWYDWVLVVLSVVPTGYVFIFHDVWILHGSTSTEFYELIFAVALSIAILEGLRRVVGFILPLLTVFFIFHPMLSAHLPGILFGRGYSVRRVLNVVYMQTDGIFSLPLNIAATIVIVFLLFGQLLLVSGGGKTMIELALSITGRVRGGGAKSAIIASSLFGTLSGSPAANTAITGTFTIPLMKSTGYKPDFSAGVEAAASTGGTVLPPVMGAVAFIMAEWLQVPYIEIAKVGLVPALILYICMFAQVDFAAARDGLLKIDTSELPSFMRTFKDSAIYLIPVAILIYFLFFLMYTPETSALWAALSIPLITVFRRETRITPSKAGDALYESARASVVVGLACAMAGIMMGSVGMTGVAVSLSSAMVDLAGGSLFILLLLAALASFLFGMGIGSIPSYIFVAIMVAPALSQMGIKTIAAHMFVFWFAMSAFITPPICVSAYVASAIAQCSAMRAGMQAVRIGIGFILIPFAFIYNQSLIMQGSAWELAVSGTAVIIGIIAISAGLERYLLRLLNWLEIGILLMSGILMLFPVLWIRLLALGIIGVVVLMQLKGRRSSRSKSPSIPL